MIQIKKFFLIIFFFFVITFSRIIEIIFIVGMCCFWILFCAWHGRQPTGKLIARYGAKLYKSTLSAEATATPTKKNIKKLRKKYGW